MKKPLRISRAVARELLHSWGYETPTYDSYAKKLSIACRAVRVLIERTHKGPPHRYVCICGRSPNHEGDHEDVAGGIWW